MAVAVGDQRRRKEAMELLVQEIIKSEDDAVGNALRTAIDRGWLSSFSEVLREAKKKKDAEIDRICSRHYTDFLYSVREMLRMQSETRSLRASLQGVHDEFHTTGARLLSALDALDGIQTERDNARRLLESSLRCEEIARQMVRVNECIAKDEHYAAMRGIESIESYINNNNNNNNNINNTINNSSNSNYIGNSSTRSALPTPHTPHTPLSQHTQQTPLPQSMQRLLERWLPIATNKLLYAARAEAEVALTHWRTHAARLGQGLLCRQAQLCLGSAQEVRAEVRNHIAQSALSLSACALPQQHTLSHTLSQSSSPPMNTLSLTHTHAQQALVEELLSLFFPASLTLSLSAKHMLSQVSLFMLNARWAPLPLSLSASVSQHHTLLVTQTQAERIAQSALLDESATYNAAPLHKALHLYAVLRRLPNFLSFYAQQREDALARISRQFESNCERRGVVSAASLFLDELVGFCAVESLVAQSMDIAAEPFAARERERLCVECISSFESRLLSLAITLPSCDDILQIKDEIMLTMHVFCDEMFRFYAAARALLRVCEGLWEAFDALLCAHTEKEIALALQRSAYQPFFASSLSLSLSQVKAFSLDTVVVDAAHASDTQRDRERLTAERTLTNLDANLDALEEEITLSLSPAKNTHSNTFTYTPTASSDNSHGKTENSTFVPQTYAFSEFVPAMMRSAHAAALRLFLFSAVKLPSLTQTHTETQTNSQPNTHHAHSSQSVSRAHTTPKVQAPARNGSTLSPSRRELLRGTWEERVSASLANVLFSVADALTQELRRDGAETALSKACQILLDAATLSLALESLWSMLEASLAHFIAYDFYAYDNSSELSLSHTQTHHTQSSQPHTHARSQTHAQERIHAVVRRAADDVSVRLRAVTSQAQDLVFELLSLKIRDLLESLVFIDFAPLSLLTNTGSAFTGAVNLQSTNAHFVHETVESIVEFLTITFMWLTHLPLYLREAIYFTSCSQLANGIVAHLCSARVSAINVFSLVALDADCKRLLAFADSCGVQSLKLCFAELQEFVRCLLSNDLTNVVENEDVREQVYPHIGASKLAVLLDKMVPSPLTAVASNLPRYEKGPTKALVKKLRAQASQS